MSLQSALRENKLGKIKDILNSSCIDLNTIININGNEYLSLNYSAYYCNVEISQLLIKHGADVNKEIIGVCSPPLHKAAEKQNMEMIKLLVSSGADVNKVNYSGETVLHFAARRSYVEIVEYLFESTNIDCLIFDKNGKTASDLAEDKLTKIMLKKKQNEQENQIFKAEIIKLKAQKVTQQMAIKERELGELESKTENLLKEIAQKMDELAVLQQDFSLAAVELDELRAIRDKMFAKDENKNLLVKESALECLYCFELPAPPKRVFMCVNGHSFCSECGEKFTKCPQCRVPIDRKIPNHQLEHVVACHKEK